MTFVHISNHLVDSKLLYISLTSEMSLPWKMTVSEKQAFLRLFGGCMTNLLKIDKNTRKMVKKRHFMGKYHVFCYKLYIQALDGAPNPPKHPYFNLY